ncbi:DM13 domain-containing protein [Sphingomicrobium arenosum]|uniref:DM13 domain-containing protein n=1 Tax=Sphingomicrobium arenosum TaxID=2233861 RepID=UPI00223F36CF|nr:DM13 domain-containing protein [Sphingomicrobium arenosum]
MKRLLLLALTHLVALAIGFAAGVYTLPIITAEAAPDRALLERKAAAATYWATLVRDLGGSDRFHWGEGEISVSPDGISFQGELAPGPDYKVYLVDGFVEDEAAFLAVKDAAARIGAVKSFDGFALDLPEGVDIEDYDTVVIWCERFEEFISAGRYR